MKKATSDKRQRGLAPHRAVSSGAGFTLYELLVIVGIMTILTSIVFAYTRRSEGQIALFRDRAALASGILRAKATAIQTFRTDPASGPVCGYGIRLERRRFVIFRELPEENPLSGALQCSSAPDFYSGAEEEIEVYTFDTRVTLSFCGDNGSTCAPIGSGNSAALEVLFVPPDPRVFFLPSDASWSEFRIAPVLLDGSSRAADVVINRAGQVAVGL